jgi:hypothetical protein
MSKSANVRRRQSWGPECADRAKSSSARTTKVNADGGVATPRVATYVLAIIAAMLFEMVTKIQVTPLRVVLGTLVLGLTFVPPLPGSMLVVAGVSSLAGYHMVRYEVVLGLLLYVVAMSFPLYWLRGRTATRG